MLSLSNLIGTTWLLYNKNFKTYLKLSFWLFIFTLPTAGVGLLRNSFSFSVMFNIAVNIIVSFLVFILTIFMTIVLIRVADKQLSSKEQKIKISLKDEFSTALSLWPEVLLVSIIVGLIQLAGFVLLIIPGIIFSVWFGFALYFVIFEKAKIKESLVKSKALVRGRFWGVFLRILVPSILWSLFAWAVSIIFVNLIDLVIKFAPSTVSSFRVALDIIKVFGVSYLEVLFVPLFVITMVVLFRNLQAIYRK